MRFRRAHIKSTKAFHLDFEEYSKGDILSDLGNGVTVTAKRRKRKNGPYIDATAMVFDSSNPSGGDWDLGTPNQNFETSPGVKGPGIGSGGASGVYQNDVPLGNVLIVSEDNDSLDPDDSTLILVRKMVN